MRLLGDWICIFILSYRKMPLPKLTIFEMIFFLSRHASNGSLCEFPASLFFRDVECVVEWTQFCFWFLPMVCAWMEACLRAWFDELGKGQESTTARWHNNCSSVLKAPISKCDIKMTKEMRRCHLLVVVLRLNHIGAQVSLLPDRAIPAHWRGKACTATCMSPLTSTHIHTEQGKREALKIKCHVK